jgi:hypothetical protein
MVSAVGKAAVLLFVIFSLSGTVVLFGAGRGQSAGSVPVTTLQDKYNALAAPGIIMLPVSGTSAVPSEVLTQIENELLRQLVDGGKLKPVRMHNWLFTTYKNKASNPFVVINAIRSEDYVFPLRYIGKPSVFRGGNKYYFSLYVYSLQTYYPVNIMRQLDIASLTDGKIAAMVASCGEELDARFSREASGPARKRVVVDDFKLDFFQLAKLSSGEFEFISSPFLEAEGTTLREGDDFFSRVMGYVLSTTGMFQVFQLGDFREYSNANISTTTALVDYRVQGRVQLSRNECVLYVDVIDVRTGASVVSLLYPLLSYSFSEVWNAYRELSFQIVSALFNRESFGIVPEITYSGYNFFANNMFIGWDKVENYVLPKGLHIISAELSNLKENRKRFLNYYVFLDYKGVVFPDEQGQRVWNLLGK